MEKRFFTDESFDYMCFGVNEGGALDSQVKEKYARIMRKLLKAARPPRTGAVCLQDVFGDGTEKERWPDAGAGFLSLPPAKPASLLNEVRELVQAQDQEGPPPVYTRSADGSYVALERRCPRQAGKGAAAETRSGPFESAQVMIMPPPMAEGWFPVVVYYQDEGGSSHDRE